MNRAFKAAPFPIDADFNDHIASGDGSRGIKGWTGHGKGPLHHREFRYKRRENG